LPHRHPRARHSATASPPPPFTTRWILSPHKKPLHSIRQIARFNIILKLTWSFMAKRLTSHAKAAG
ncbi:MAG: hypothetical protein ACK6DX_06415, partial [Acidobacteriota bacterium]